MAGPGTTVIDVSIGRTLLGLSALTFNTDGSAGYHFGELTGDGVQWERNTVTSPWVHGRRLRSARRQFATLTGELYVVSDDADNPAQHDDALAELLAALSQFTYTISIQATDGAASRVWQYACEPADCTPGESLMVNARCRWTTVAVSIPYSPLTNSGSW